MSHGIEEPVAQLTPILICAFVRSTKFKVVVDSLAGLSNPVYFWFDGPRDNTDDAMHIQESIRIAKSSNLNTMEIITNSTNSGTNSVAMAISWIFKKYDRAIIIEEDVVVSRFFISFAEEMLRLYENDFRIGSVTSMNLVPQEFISNLNTPYRFSSFFYAWGWATWSSRWNKMSHGTSDWDYSKIIWPKGVRNKLSQSRWLIGLNAVRDGSAPGLWDYRWIYCYWVNGWLTIVPNLNLGMNIGFSFDATHTQDKPSWAPTEISSNLRNELLNPIVKVKPDVRADKWAAKHVHSSSPMVVLKTKVKHYINSFRFKLSI